MRRPSRPRGPPLSEEESRRPSRPRGPPLSEEESRRPPRPRQRQLGDKKKIETFVSKRPGMVPQEEFKEPRLRRTEMTPEEEFRQFRKRRQQQFREPNITSEEESGRLEMRDNPGDRYPNLTLNEEESRQSPVSLPKKGPKNNIQRETFYSNVKDLAGTPEYPYKEREQKYDKLSNIPSKQLMESEEQYQRPPVVAEETDTYQITNVKEGFNERDYPEKPSEKFIKQPSKVQSMLSSQELGQVVGKELFQDKESLSKKRALVNEVEEEIQKTDQQEKKSSLKLKLKLLKDMVAEEEEQILRNPLSKVKKLIDTQGETIEEANYETFTTDSCFNRVPQSEDNSNCQLDMNEYMKKSEVENNYISKSELNQDYIRKDSIPCWGCNIK